MNRQATGSLARSLAAKAVDAVVSDGRNLDAALAALDMSQLEERDVSLIRALTYGTLRTHLRNKALLSELLSKPLKKKDSVIEALLSVGLFALMDSQRPDYAVVSATVSAVDQLGRKHMRGMVNAVLRRFLREKDELLNKLSGIEATTCHPQWFVEQLQRDWPDDWEKIVAAGNRQGPMWVRVNTAHNSPEEWLQRCGDAEILVNAPHKELTSACLLESPLAVSELPGFRDGACSVQDIASQLPALLLQPEPGMRVLDACAAPGGKAAHLLELCPDAELIAIDVSAERLERVEDNFERLGLRGAVICGDATRPDDWWDGEQFDRILIDAPCSATGVIRRHPDIRFLRRNDDIAELNHIQTDMLGALWPLLKPGGLLLYSTCSVLRAENERVVGSFLTKQSEAEEQHLDELSPFAGVPTAHGLQLLPATYDNDGFYYALLKKQA